MTAANNKYLNLQRSGLWMKATADQEKIIALEAKVEQLKKTKQNSPQQPKGKDKGKGKDKNKKGKKDDKCLLEYQGWYGMMASPARTVLPRPSPRQHRTGSISIIWYRTRIVLYREDSSVPTHLCTGTHIKTHLINGFIGSTTNTTVETTVTTSMAILNA